MACKTCEAGLWVLWSLHAGNHVARLTIPYSKCRIDDLKAAYKDLDVDNRFYSILPHYLEDQYTRVFWKPTCDELQRDMAEFEVRSPMPVHRHDLHAKMSRQASDGTSLLCRAGLPRKGRLSMITPKGRPSKRKSEYGKVLDRIAESYYARNE